MPDPLNRRNALRCAVAAGATSVVLPLVAGGLLDGRSVPAAEPLRALKGRIHQSIVYWCFHTAGDKWDIEKMCLVARQLGCHSIELADPTEWPTIKRHGLICAIAPNGMPGAPFMKGFNNPRYRDELLANTTKMIDACADAKFPAVIAFTGFKWRDADDPKSGAISPEEGADNCVQGLKAVALHAEKKGVTLCLEHLNSRDTTSSSKGHPGYQGDDVDYVANILQRVGSDRVKMLFDIYHVQIMNGDVIRRIEECKDIIGHIHTAGNPGRGELDNTQEINYPPIMRKLLEVGYTGYVGQEFIPTRDPLTGLSEAVTLCDV